MAVIKFDFRRVHMKNYPIDPELKKYCRSIPFSPLMLRVSLPPMRLMYAATPIENGVRHRKDFAETGEGRVRLDVFEPEHADEKTPVLFYLHGGGFGYIASPFHKKLAAVYAKKANCRVVCPDYRLLPKHPYPAAKNDCLAAYRDTVKKYPNAKIAVGGDSAGGALSIYTVNAAEKTPCLQLLLYPVCDPKQGTPSMKEFTDTPFWNSKNNEIMWRIYAGEHSFDEVSPLEGALPEKIAPAYIELAQFDCLHDEGAAYAEKLRNAGGQVTLTETKGTVHGYDIALGTKIVEKYVALRIEALRSAFYGG